ncbi:MAG: hypothetical protein VKJ24_15625 [Synechococcales bacterium]|nr:hypothetical protein [Synechococcales bacterium]
MPRNSRFSVRSFSGSDRIRPRGAQPMLNTRQLDLVLLAGCSCLLTMLCQPLASALVAPTAMHHAFSHYPDRIQNMTYIVMYHNHQIKQAVDQPAP